MEGFIPLPNHHLKLPREKGNTHTHTPLIDYAKNISSCS